MQYSCSQPYVGFSYDGGQNWPVKSEALDAAIF